MPNAARQLPPFKVPQPFGGVSEAAGFSDQPEGTCIDAMNVFPNDPRTDRQRISKRPGIANIVNAQLNGSTALQDINEVVISVSETVFEDLLAPTVLWDTDVTTAAGTPNIKGVAVDKDGNVYVCGDEENGLSVWKLDKDDGSVLKSFATGAATKGIALSPSSVTTQYVYVVGLGTTGVHLWKLDTDLVSQHTADIGTTTQTMYGVKVDTDDNAYVTGDRNTQWDGKAPASGAQRNVWKLDSDLAFDDTIDMGATIDLVALALLEDRSVVVCGPVQATYSVWWGAFTAVAGVDTYTARKNAGDAPKGVVVDSTGRTIVVGKNTSGVNLWIFDTTSSHNLVTSFNVGGGTVDLTAIAVDDDDNIFVVGDFAANPGVHLWKFDKDLEEKWSYVTSGTTTGLDAVAVVLEGDIAIGGDDDADGNQAMLLKTKDKNVVILEPRSKKYIACAGGTLKRFIPGVGFVDIVGGSGGLRTAGRVFSTQAYSRVYFVDGNNYRYWDPVSNRFISWVPTAGNLPDDADGNGNSDTGKSCRLIDIWRGRVVLSGAGDDPHNWFMSKVADPLDWDYSPADQSEAQAVAGNNSPAGKIGDVITSLVPYSDDLLIMGGDASIWRMTGDPMAGGRIDLVSDTTGMAFGRAWCKDPEGFLYFFGRLGGMFRMAPGGIPERLSNGRIDKRLWDVDTAANIVRMVWDHEHQGVLLMITPLDKNVNGTHYYWDKRTDSFWPISFADSNLDPTAMYVIDGDSVEDRWVLFGGRNGYIRNFYNPGAWDAPADAGGELNAIDAYVWLGPMSGGTDREVKVRGWRWTMGENTDSAYAEVYTGDSVEEAFASTAVFTSTLGPGRNGSINEHARGAAVMVKVGNKTVNEFFSLENLLVQPIAGGQVRVR